MALTRKQLAAMGIEAEKIDEIITSHTETVNGLKDKITQLEGDLKTAQEKADKLPDVEKELNDLKQQNADDAKAREGKDYDALKKEFDDYKAEISARDVKAAKEKALREVLKDLNMSDKGISLVMKYQNFDGIELDEDGKIKGAADLRKSLKEDWGDYVVKSETKGAETKTPPGDGGGSKGYKTKDEIMAIKDDSERHKAIADNPELFGIEE